MVTFNYTFSLLSDKDIDYNITQLGILLRKLNNDYCVYKYKFLLSIDSDNVTFDKEIGSIKISDDFFEQY